jgi:DNA-binding NarL/FixJ family response regulator
VDNQQITESYIADCTASSRLKASHRILVVHGDARVRCLWRNSLNALEDVEIVESPEAHHALSLLRTVVPDVAVVARELPGLGGIELTREMVSLHPTIAVILCDGSLRLPRLMESLRAGARCYLADDLSADLLRAARLACRGGSYFSDEARVLLTQMMLEEYVFRLRHRATASEINTLTPREREVLQGLVSGRTSKEMACDLAISIRTVDTHRARIMHKLHVHSLMELTKLVLLDSEE